ncbi:hypothetical protein LguiB_032723 [Lonicera macranthoides]
MHSLQAEDIDGSEVDAIRPLPWYPENLAWHSNFSRMQLRKNQTLEKFHEFLKLENEIGNITRQEAVSMVPPLFLDVRPDHFVLDMCVAPGSKTFQLLEMIHMSTEPGTLPTGMVIANDADVQRCNLLIHQTKRMCTANLIVTNHEAQRFPSCHLSKSHTNASENGTAKEPLISELIFDRVLCDVPCRGDGTLRKAPDIWRKWTVGMGNGVHCLQVQIAIRGFIGSSSNLVNSYKTCYYGVPTPIKVCRTSDNPDRRFFGCKNYKVQPCAYFQWVDEDDGIESRLLEFHYKVQELSSANQQLQRRYGEDRKKCDELKKQGFYLHLPRLEWETCVTDA